MNLANDRRAHRLFARCTLSWVRTAASAAAPQVVADVDPLVNAAIHVVDLVVRRRGSTTLVARNVSHQTSALTLGPQLRTVNADGCGSFPSWWSVV